MDLVSGIALVATVLVVTSLAAGLVERAPLSFPMLFLGLGVVLGDGVTGALPLSLDSPLLEAIAFVTLALVLFLDAVNLDLDALRGHWVVPALTLGPGTLLVIGLIAAASSLLLGFGLVSALLTGAILASTDPVVLRDVLRDRRVPGAVRRTLSLEAGTNDLIVLPPVLILIAVASGEVGGVGGWTLFGLQLLLVGPFVGALIGVAGARMMSWADDRFTVRTEYQALYGIGLVLAAFAAGDTIGTDGFLASFAAGAAVALSNHTLCDCFLDFGGTLSEVLMLVAFVVFGAVLSPLLPSVSALNVALLALVVLVAARPVAIGALLSVRRAGVSPAARAFIAWFGPRGLNSLLLALLVVRAEVPGAQTLFAIVGAVVLVSVVVHGASATPLSAWYGRAVEAATLPEERSSTAMGLLESDADDIPRITVEDLARRLDAPDPPIVVDVRSRSAFAGGREQIPGAIRVLSDEVAGWARDQTRDRLIVLYCT